MWPRPARRALLDQAAPGLPVVVISADLHAVWCNALALTHFAAPLVGRPLAAGEDGVLREQDAFDVTGALSRVPDDVLDGYVADAVEAAAARGVTRVRDLEMVFGIDRGRGACRPAPTACGSTRACTRASSTQRSSGGCAPATSSRAPGASSGWAVQGDHRRVARHEDRGDGLGRGCARVRVRGPRRDGPPRRRRRTRPRVHAIGDRANTLALDVFEAVGGPRHDRARPAPRGGRRRAVRTGSGWRRPCSPSTRWTTGTSRTATGLVRRTGRSRSRRLDRPVRRLLLGSDAPVAPLDPWVSMAAAVGRDRDGREPWHPPSDSRR